jgi:hypothetical protein
MAMTKRGAGMRNGKAKTLPVPGKSGTGMVGRGGGTPLPGRGVGNTRSRSDALETRRPAMGRPPVASKTRVKSPAIVIAVGRKPPAGRGAARR